MDLNAKLQDKQLSLAKRGIIWNLISAVFWGCIFTAQDGAMAREPFVSAAALGILAVPCIFGGLQDSVSAVYALCVAAKKGKVRETFRAAFSGPGLWIIVASLCSGPIACNFSIASVYYAGSVYPVAISALFPAVGAVLSRLILKERLSGRSWFGILLGVAGAIVIGYAPPAGETYRNFTIGILFAVIAAIGWGVEGVFSVKGMDYIDPEVASFIRIISSAVFYLAVFVPLFAGLGRGYAVIGQVFTQPVTLAYVAVAALFNFVAYWLYYRAVYACGAARAMALYILYVFVSGLVGIITGTSITGTYILGAAALVVSCILIAGRPADLLKLREER